MLGNNNYEQLETTQFFSYCFSLSSYFWSSVFDIILSQIYFQIYFIFKMSVNCLIHSFGKSMLHNYIIHLYGVFLTKAYRLKVCYSMLQPSVLHFCKLLVPFSVILKVCSEDWYWLMACLWLKAQFPWSHKHSCLFIQDTKLMLRTTKCILWTTERFWIVF